MPEAGEGIYRLDDELYADDVNIDIIHYHYIGNRRPTEGLLMRRDARPKDHPRYWPGSIVENLRRRRIWNKPITFDETFGGIVHFTPPPRSQNRMEGWESLFAGCAGYDHLDWTFTPYDPLGRGTPHQDLPQGLPPEWLDGQTVRRQLGYLASFARSLPFLDMEPDGEARVASLEGVVKGFVLRHRHGRRISIYLVDARRQEEGFGSSLSAKVKLTGLDGKFAVRRLDPKTGEAVWLEDVEGGQVVLDIDDLREDLVLDLCRLPLQHRSRLEG